MAITSQELENDQIARRTIMEYEYMSGYRGNWNSHWEEVADRVMPSDQTLFVSRGTRAEGVKRTQELFDSTAQMSLLRFAAILDSLLTPRNQTWHKLTVDHPGLKKDRATKLWLEQTNRLLFKFRYAPDANFSSQNQQNYKSLGAYGNGIQFIDQLHTGEGIRYRNVHLSECYLGENHQGMIDRIYRYFPLTARQAIGQFGAQALPDQITNMMNSNPLTMFWFIHAVGPREQDYDPFRKDYRGMPWYSHYVSMQGSKLVSTGGYTSFPYAISRYEQYTGEVYGRSPAMEVLPVIKTLNEQKKTMLKQGHRAVDPVLMAHDDGIASGFSLKPGALNYGGVTADGKPLIHALPVGNVQYGKDMMDDERSVIKDAFLVSLFQILTENPQMTATEVMERTREKGILLAPTIGRQQSEYLGPMIHREIDVLARQGLLPPLPPALVEAHGEYNVMYDSPLNRMQRSEEAAGLMRTVENAITVAQATQDPSMLDNFDWDVILPEIADIQGVPARWMNSKEKIDELRKKRAQDKQVEQMSQAAPGAAAVMNAQTKNRQAGGQGAA